MISYIYIYIMDLHHQETSGREELLRGQRPSPGRASQPAPASRIFAPAMLLGQLPDIS